MQRFAHFKIPSEHECIPLQAREYRASCRVQKPSRASKAACWSRRELVSSDEDSVHAPRDNPWSRRYTGPTETPGHSQVSPLRTAHQGRTYRR
jgi:hypothetical protein